VNKKTNPTDHINAGLGSSFPPSMVAIHLNTLTPVGIAIIIVAAVKYARVSTSSPTVNM